MLTEKRPDLSTPHLAERRRMWVQLQALNADLLRHNSATAVLQSLCDRRDPGSPRIRARKISVIDTAQEFESVGRELGAPADAALIHRRVELMCGDTVLCRADNWYLPDRLTDQMNAQLLAGETPFGVVVRALDFRRQTLSSRLLFDPVPSDRDCHPVAGIDPASPLPEDVLQHRAMLQTLDGCSFSLLLETYTKQTLTA
jgi:chorismate-pyruvate lyase